MRPALPNEVSSAAPRRSTSTTERPRFCKCKATQMPTIPAPRTTTSAPNPRMGRSMTKEAQLKAGPGPAGVSLPALGARHQFLFAGGQLLAERLEIELGFF